MLVSTSRYRARTSRRRVRSAFSAVESDFPPVRRVLDFDIVRRELNSLFDDKRSVVHRCSAPTRRWSLCSDLDCGTFDSIRRSFLRRKKFPVCQTGLLGRTLSPKNMMYTSAGETLETLDLSREQSTLVV